MTLQHSDEQQYHTCFKQLKQKVNRKYCNQFVKDYDMKCYKNNKYNKILCKTLFHQMRLYRCNPTN